MKVVVAGGTGFLGRHIASALVDAGCTVSVLSRRPEAAARIRELHGLEAIRADAIDPRSLTGKLDGMDAVVAAVQFPNHPVEVPRKGLTYDRYDRGATENLLYEAQSAGVERFFYLSGAGADPRSDKTWYRAKGRAELLVRDSGLRWAILRPSWAYGPGDRALNRIAAVARWAPVVPQLGIRPQRIQPVYAKDIALAVRRVFERDDAWESVYEIGSPDIMTMNQVIHTLIDVLGKRRAVVPVPAALAKAATAPLIALPRPPMTPQGVDFAVQDGLVDISAVVERLDVRPLRLRDGLTRYLAA